MEEHQRFVTEALERFEDLPSKTPHDRDMCAWIMMNHSNAATTWLCDEYMNRVVAADDPQAEYVHVIVDMVDNYVPYSQAMTDARDEPMDLPEWFGDPLHIASECHAFSHRIVKGALNEMLAASHLRASGCTIMLNSNAKRFAAFDGKLDKNHGIDIVAVHPDGSVETIQVKSSTGEAGKYSGDADTILIADAESQEVNEY